MTAGSDVRAKPIYIPLDQGERANHLYVDQLLPRPIYERLAQMLQESLDQMPEEEEGSKIDKGDSFSRQRAHATVFLDGDRGSGKTTVIVNLPAYLDAPEVRERYPHLADQVHVLRPIDPSQLEDDDDLFLNVVVAAVLGDKEIQSGRERNPILWQALYDSLQDLGKALAGKETQDEGVGLDRLRSFRGAKELAGAVHDFFAKAAKLLDKRILILPIDDVDTTLHRAFENLEVVRRYLASPALLPIVCGDLNLYREVTWRDVFRRLSKGINKFDEEARFTAESLALEYLRKILPLHRRLRMPEVRDFLQDDNILLGTPRDRAGSQSLTLPNMEAWLRALLAGPVNDHENSRIRIPIPTVRALSQLLSRVRDGIPTLERAFLNEHDPHPTTALMRRIVHGRRGDTKLTSGSAGKSTEEAAPNALSIPKWQSALFDHFMFEPNAGALCLVLMAARHWHTAPKASVLATPLFIPLQQIGRHELRYIQSRATLNWVGDLAGRLPDSWVHNLADDAILPFASPEVGRAVVPDRWRIDPDEYGDEFPAELPGLLTDLITHHNFYSSSKRATLICSGRILELVVTSIVRDVTVQDVDRILSTAPFHSAVGVAGTKAAQLSVDELDELIAFESEEEVSGRHSSDDEDTRQGSTTEALDRDIAIEILVGEVNGWRREVGADRVQQSPWLMYCALNKTLNQVRFFTRPLQPNEQPSREALSDVVASGLSAFNSFWAALASFEKGPIFDLPLELSTVNLINRRGDFQQNNLYTQNIRPLLKEEHDASHGEQIVPVTWTLNTHPLRKRLQDLFDFAVRREQASVASGLEPVDGRGFFLATLRFSPKRRRVTVADVVKILERDKPQKMNAARFGDMLHQKIAQRFPQLPELNTLRRAIAALKSRPAGAR
jgi:hypothetical protein